LLVLLFMIVLFGGLLTVPLITMLPDIRSDATMARAGKAEVDPNATVSGSCKRMKFIFVDCSANITYQPDPASPATATLAQSFTFVGGDYNNAVTVLRSKANPRLVTTSLAVDHLSNRMVTMIGFLLIFAALLYYSVGELRRTLQGRALAGKAKMLRPVLATLLSSDEHNNIGFTATVDGKVIKGSNRLRDGDSMFGVNLDQTTVLAVLVAGTRHLILVDSDMTVIDLSDAEREQLRVAAS
jgi:hypothetical protein